MKKHTQRHLFWLAAIFWSCLIFVLSHQPGSVQPPMLFPEVDKLVHALIFAMMAYLFFEVFFRAEGVPLKSAALYAFGIASLYGGMDEFHQSFIPGRHAGWEDWLADTVGALFVLWLLARTLQESHTHE